MSMPNPKLFEILSGVPSVPEEEFVVYGVVYADPEHADDVENMYAQMTELAQTEEGIIYYCLARDPEHRSVFHFFERYTGKKAFDTHNQNPLVQKLLWSGWMKGVSARFSSPITPRK